ncbi:MAG: chemotaxis protein CheW [Gammaproteobacteria bacterium]|nr:chemotaxis protein CheW [Gammaproteobacteria bacterium]
MSLAFVDKVIYLAEAQTVPGMPPYFIGLLNVHGNKTPIIDLALKLAVRSESSYSVNTPVILCQNEKQHVGFIVDEIVDVDDLKVGDLGAQNLFKGEIVKYLQGSIPTTHGEALLLNPQKIFAEEDALDTD